MSAQYPHAAASPSPALRGKAGMGDSAQMSRLSAPRSSPINGGGRRCNMSAQYQHVAASPSSALRGKAGMGDSAQRKSFVPHLNPPPYMGEEDAAICPIYTSMWQRLLPPRRGGRPGWGIARRGSRLSPTSVLPHKWGRKTLLYVSSIPACGSVSFPRAAGEGWDGGQRAPSKSTRTFQTYAHLPNLRAPSKPTRTFQTYAHLPNLT